MKKTTLIISILGFLLIVVLFFVIFPSINEINEINTKNNELKNEVTILQKRQERLSSIKNMSLEKLEPILPSSKPGLDLLGHINNLTQDSELSWKNYDINPGDLATPSGKIEIMYMNFGLDLSGKIEGLKKMFNEINGYYRQLFVNNFTYSYDTYRNDGSIKANVQLLIYYQPLIKTSSENLTLSPEEQTTINALLAKVKNSDETSLMKTLLPTSKKDNPFTL